VKVNLGFRTRIVAGVLAVLAVPVLVVGLTTLIAVKATSLPDGVALRVDGVDVTKAEVAKQSNVLTLLYGIQPPDNPAAFDRFRRSSAQTVALDRVLDRAAVEAGLGVSDKTAADALNQLLASGGALGPKNFGTALSASGVNQQDLLEEIKRQSLTQQLYQRVVEQAGAQRPVTDQEVQQFFDEHRSEMVRLETRHLRNILVADEAAADKVLEQAKAGVDFGQLAQVNSIDSTTKGKGGDLGVLNRSILEDDYAAGRVQCRPGRAVRPGEGFAGVERRPGSGGHPGGAAELPGRRRGAAGRHRQAQGGRRLAGVGRRPAQAGTRGVRRRVPSRGPGLGAGGSAESLTVRPATRSVTDRTCAITLCTSDR